MLIYADNVLITADTTIFLTDGGNVIGPLIYADVEVGISLFNPVEVVTECPSIDVHVVQHIGSSAQVTKSIYGEGII